MLRTALDAHRQIVCLGELFNPAHPFGRHGLTSVEAGLRWTSQFRKGARAIGFVAHYHGPGMPIPTGPASAWPALWRELPQALPPDTIVILLRRTNLLRRHVSHLAALQTKQWTWTAPYGKREPTPFSVDPQLLQADMAWFQSAYQEVERLFSNLVTIDYETLLDDWDGQITRLQKALGVAPEAIVPASRKQGGALREIVANYDELKEQFRGQAAEVFFDE